jgi:hypothetical protein|tara:strand:+ start:1276 stop:1752 length:477 start_codon:yes stop_codon:yes gene_type:complete
MADFMADLNSGIDAWIPELFKRVQRDFQIDTNAQLEDVNIIKEGAGHTLTYSIPDKSKTDIPTEKQQVWVPASTYMAKDKKSGRMVTRKRKGYKKTIEVEVSNINRDSASQQEGDKAKSSANSTYRVVELTKDYMFGDDLPQFLQTYLKSKGWNVGRN